MGKIHIEFETDYDKGDVVVFKQLDGLRVGIIEGYYVSNNVIWYNIRISKDSVLTYANGGDVAEFDIIHKLDDCDNVRQFITEGDH